EKQLQLAATVFENASDAIVILDTEFRHLAANDCFSRITGYSDEEIHGKHPKELVDDSGEPVLRESMSMIMEGLKEEGFWQGELKGYRKTGELFPVWMQLSTVYDDHGNITHYVGMFSDLTTRKQTEEKLQFLSNFDRLTGLPNRTMFQEKLEQSLEHAKLKQTRLAIVYFDLDRFRSINESLGHEIGDKLLQKSADRLRALDIDEANLSRINADEFCLIIENVSEKDDVERLCQEAINIMRRPFTISGHELSLGLSIGISIFPDDAAEAKTLINQADLAVHQAKRQGGNTIQHYRADMRSVSVEQLALETSLRKAIFKNEFVLHFQPKLDLASGEINACEALVRWQHPTMGLLYPGDFIPLAEESGLISAIGEWVLERACRQGAVWADEGRPVKIAVNMSAHQLRKGDLVEVVTRVLDITRLHPSLLELELTESLIVEDLEKNIEILNQLREIGVQLSL
ncbi:MAG: diguanylate cyclase, partial [Kangiellaceae bacterium]|nr:diguanylate cyclase [Kangiellaceae bacterium]